MISRTTLASAFEAIADELADIAYNRMQKSDEANAVFDRAQRYRRAAYWLDDTANRGIERAAIGFGIGEHLISVG